MYFLGIIAAVYAYYSIKNAFRKDEDDLVIRYFSDSDSDEETDDMWTNGYGFHEDRDIGLI